MIETELFNRAILIGMITPAAIIALVAASIWFFCFSWHNDDRCKELESHRLWPKPPNDIWVGSIIWITVISIMMWVL